MDFDIKNTDPAIGVMGGNAAGAHPGYRGSRPSAHRGAKLIVSTRVTPCTASVVDAMRTTVPGQTPLDGGDPLRIDERWQGPAGSASVTIPTRPSCAQDSAGPTARLPAATRKKRDFKQGKLDHLRARTA
ncbi:hypothetical protein FLP41_01690 (plasmid) [Paracoccus marcusii]|uniref:hypothetical protein n=1 Tax=Paracoccus marcusii TaxID=59779 RepID=UPI002ED33D13|nr:hypothetical protein FLP41_01690 [Paracoccus marcusii]